MTGASSKPSITTVVFDMDGVLCHYRIERRMALLASWSEVFRRLATRLAVASSVHAAVRRVVSG